MDETFRVEVGVLCSILDDIDYFQLLVVPKDASSKQIQSGFFKQSKLFHPDRYHSVADAAFKEQIMTIYKRITEAYGVLRDEPIREMYIEQLMMYGKKRLDRATAEKEKASGVNEILSKSAQGRKFEGLARECLKNDDLQGARLNLQMATFHEKDNVELKAFMEEINQQANARKKAR